MIRILIADDSAFMRMVLSDLFKKQADFEVLDTARNGEEAVEKAVKLRPDLVIMDVNMPVMDGLQALEVIMQECPTRVVMFSSLTKEGADATIQALHLGAIDFINKVGGAVCHIEPIENEILSKCRTAAKTMLRHHGPVWVNVASSTPSAEPSTTFRPMMRRIELPKRQNPILPSKPMPAMREKPVLHPIPPANAVGGKHKLVVLGTSTGGPKALQTVISHLPKDLPCGVLVVQHMPPGFTKSLAERLNEISQISVKEAENHDMIEAGHVYIAPGDYHMTVSEGFRGREILLNQDPPLGTLRPAADVLFKSVAALGRDIVSVILTGMGSDGAVGMRQIKEHGGYIIAEAEETCVVYGMPRAVVEQGIADEVLPLQNVADAIVNAVNH